MPQPLRILATTYGGGHAKMVAPVLCELARRRYTECTVLALTTARRAMAEQGFVTLGFSDLVQPGDEEALRIGRQLAEGLPPHPEIAHDETVAYLGLSFHDLQCRLGPEEAASRFATQGRQALLPIGPVERVFDRVQPDVVLTTNSPRAEEATLRVARRRGVPSVCMIDLFGGFDLPRVRENDYADRVCVLSEAVKRTFVEAGRRAEDLVVTGNPAFDSLGDPRHRQAAVELRKSRGWLDSKVVLWISQAEPSDPDLPRRIDRALLEACIARGWRLLIRPHPSEQSLPDEAFPDGAGVSRQSDPLASTVLAADVIVVISSTVGLEAALLDKPVVAIDVPITVETAPYVEMGIALRATLADLVGPLDAALALRGNPAQGLPPCGQAAARVADVVESVAP